MEDEDTAGIEERVDGEQADGAEEDSTIIDQRLSGKLIFNKPVVVCFIELFNFYMSNHEGIMHCLKRLLKAMKNKAIEKTIMKCAFFYELRQTSVLALWSCWIASRCSN